MKKTLFIAAAFLLAAAALAHEAPAGPATDQTLIKKLPSTPGQTHHLEVKPESLDGRRLPYMTVTATVIDQDSGQIVSRINLHPMFGGNFHYGANVALEPKTYLLRFHLDPPSLVRGDERKNQWLIPVEAEFTFDAAAPFADSIKIGQKDTRDMKISFEAERPEEMFALASDGDHPMMMDDDGMNEMMTGDEMTTDHEESAAKQNSALIIIGLAGLVIGFILSRFLKPAA